MPRAVDLFEGPIPELDRFADHRDTKRCLVELTEAFGIKHATYLSATGGAAVDEGIHLTTTYGQDWIGRYIDCGYEAIDPVIALARKRLLPLDWSSIDTSARTVRDFFGEAHEHGVGNHGLSIPIRGPARASALFSITTDCNDDDWAEFRREILPRFQIVGYEFHKAVVEMEAGTAPAVAELTNREREILRWAAEGKTSWETGMILGIAERTVTFHMLGAIERLGCVNKTHAVAKAIRLGLI